MTSKVKLGEISTIVSGFAFKSTQFNTEEQGLPLIRIRDVERGFSETYYDGDYSEEFIVNDGDYLISMDGSFIIKQWHGGKALLNQRVCKISFQLSEFEEQYLYKLLPKCLKDIEARTPFVTVKHLSVKKIKNIEITQIPLTEQAAISAQLVNIEHLIHLKNDELFYFDNLVKSRFNEMFGEEKFRKVKVGETLETTSGGTPSKSKPEYYKDGIIPWLTSGEIHAGFIEQPQNFITELGLQNSSAKLVPANSIVIAMYGATAGVTGLVKYATSTNQAVCSLLPNDRFIPEYLYYSVSRNKEWMITQSRGGGQPNISQAIIQSMFIIDAPLPLQEEFARFVEAVDKSKLAVKQSLDELETLKKKLMQDYFG